MKALVTGSSGFIGSALLLALAANGHTAVRLVRDDPRRPDQVGWDISTRLDPGSLGGIEAVVHLAGADIGDSRWI
jgi:hypothetical protein